MTETVKHGKGLKRTGISLLITGSLLASAVPRSIRAGEMIKVLVISFLAIIMLSGGAFLIWRGRQYAAKATAERIIHDSKPDVLYLRAFETDPSTRGYVFSSILMPFLTPSYYSGTATEEEQLSEVLQPFGDLVAIGKPSETLPTPGAARLYVSDAEWKKVVTDQMQTARLVVIRAGSGEGLLWELKQVVQVLNPKKLLILILNMKKKDYKAFTKEADQVFEGTFPKADEIRRFARVSGFVRFSANWKPIFLPLRMPSFRQSVYKPYRRLFKFTLRPVFEEYGLEWQSPPVSIGGVLGIVLFALLFLLLIAEGKLLIACAGLVVVGAFLLLMNYLFAPETFQGRSFSPAVSRNILVAIIALFVWLTEMYIFVQLGQPDTLNNAFWIVFFPAVFVAFVWANWPLFPAISGAWRSVLRFLASTAISCLWFFVCLIAVIWFTGWLLAAA